MKQTERLAVVVVSYGSSSLLQRNLVPLAADLPEAIVVVVDSYSSPEEQREVRRLAESNSWYAVLPDHNTGFGAGTNLGVAEAVAHGAETLLLLNPDARIDVPSVAALLAAVSRDPAALVAPVIVRPDGSVWFDGVTLDLDAGRMHSRRTPGPVPTRGHDWLTGACLMLSRSLWEQVGGFDERFFLYWEDVDFSWRVQDAGGRLLLVPEATAVHDEGGTQPRTPAPAGSRGRSSSYYYYNIRNRLLFASIHLSPHDRRRWACTAVPAAYEVLMRGGRRQLLSPGPPLRAVRAGLLDGWRILAGRRPRGMT